MRPSQDNFYAVYPYADGVQLQGVMRDFQIPLTPNVMSLVRTSTVD